jgi:hypothetical protein
VQLAHVNLLNIGLMGLSLGLAMVVPFETFLLAYAVLGPLHYLTQISWLHDRAWFTQDRRDWLPLLGLCVPITALHLLATGSPDLQHLGPWSVSTFFFAFGLAFLLAVTTDRALRGAGIAVLGALAFLLHGADLMSVVFALYVPTIIHVFVFTGAFVLLGALKHRSWTAHASLLVFLACAAAALFLDPGALGYHASDYARTAYAPFGPLHLSLLHVTGLAQDVVPTAAAGTPMFPFAASVHRVRLHLPLPELVLEDLGDPLARGAEDTHGGDRRRLDRLGRAVRRRLRHRHPLAPVPELPARAAGVPARPQDVRRDRARGLGARAAVNTWIHGR